MDNEDIHILRLMGEIERNGSYSQRELARRLNLSLGLVNRFIKRLVNKGYFKIKTLPKNRVKYLLTPKGIAQKSKLTLEYLKYSLSFYRQIKALLISKFREMEKQGVKKVLFYGAGEVAELASLYLQVTGIRLAGVFEANTNGVGFLDQEVKGLERIKIKDWDGILVTSLEDVEKSIEVLKKAGVPWERIFTL